MKRDDIILAVATTAAALFLGGALTWSYIKSQVVNMPPAPPPSPPPVTAFDATGDPSDVYAVTRV